jgi:hypothetical protein
VGLREREGRLRAGVSSEWAVVAKERERERESREREKIERRERGRAVHGALDTSEKADRKAQPTSKRQWAGEWQDPESNADGTC